VGFRKDFLWGAAAAAHQIEGAFDKDGKGLGIWDALNKGHIKHNENGDIACDHYHRYKEDVALMKQIGLKSYRFSVSWPRIIPEEGVINEKGVQFYVDLVTELLDAGIEPLCTLFHWNLPMWIYDRGGWKCDKVSDWFEEYTEVVVNALSDKVKYWMTLNEPACFIGLGYVSGVHAPFLKEPENIGVLTRNTLLAHGKSVKKIREVAKQKPIIGFAPNGPIITPMDPKIVDKVEKVKEKLGFAPSGGVPKNDEAAAIEQARGMTFYDKDGFAGVMSINWWGDPILLGTIPKHLKDVISEDDIGIIHQPLDFFGFNIYHSANFSEFEGFNNPNVYPGLPRTSMGWPITPEVMYWAVKFCSERYKLPVMITENGMANYDYVMRDGKVHDPQRVEYIHSYLESLKKAADEGIDILGYQHWSIMDNFEWAQGYDMRFGLIYVDFRTQKRTLKDSAYFYAEVIKSNGENL
jgi:beta-glucosidase